MWSSTFVVFGSNPGKDLTHVAAPQRGENKPSQSISNLTFSGKIVIKTIRWNIILIFL